MPCRSMFARFFLLQISALYRSGPFLPALTLKRRRYRNLDDEQARAILTWSVIYRALNVQEIALPAGTYYLEYEVDDAFMRPSVLERIEFQWDGKNMTFPEGFTWTDETTLEY